MHTHHTSKGIMCEVLFLCLSFLCLEINGLFKHPKIQFILATVYLYEDKYLR